MSAKPKLAMYWANACGGCEIAVLNTHETIFEVDANFDVVFWPIVMDSKVKDVEALANHEITLTLFSGGMRTHENVEMAQLLRRKSKILISFGSCASEGCIPGLANLSSAQSLLDTVFNTISTDNPDHLLPEYTTVMPEGSIHLPEFYPVLRTLDQVVKVDYTIPGCPPESHQIAAVIEVVIKALDGEGALPPAGAVIGAGESTVCDECPRSRNLKTIKQFVRIQDIKNIDADLCLLEQGIPCNGLATRSGCGALCPKASAQCIGCYGPAEGVIDFGARLMTAFSSVIDSNDPVEIDRILDGIPDPVGQLYRFNLAKSLLRSSKSAWNQE